MGEEVVRDVKVQVLGLTWQHLWRIKHVKGTQGLKHQCRSFDQNIRSSTFSIDQPRNSIKHIVDRSTKIFNRATIRADVACVNSNALTTVDKPIRVFYG